MDKKGKEWFERIIKNEVTYNFSSSKNHHDEADDDFDYEFEDELDDKEDFLWLEEAKTVRLLALDVDGVLTDGTINMGPEGEVFKSFNAKDGLAISCAQRCGLRIALITGRRSEIVRRRAEELGVTLIMEGVKNKYKALTELRQSLGLKQEQVAYMGDDLNDLPAFGAAGLTFAPEDAADDVCEEAQIVTCAEGGHGAVREAIEMILRAQGRWDYILEGYRQEGQGDEQ